MYKIIFNNKTFDLIRHEIDLMINRDEEISIFYVLLVFIVNLVFWLFY